MSEHRGLNICDCVQRTSECHKPQDALQQLVVSLQKLLATLENTIEDQKVEISELKTSRDEQDKCIRAYQRTFDTQRRKENPLLSRVKELEDTVKAQKIHNGALLVEADSLKTRITELEEPTEKGEVCHILQKTLASLRCTGNLLVGEELSAGINVCVQHTPGCCSFAFCPVCRPNRGHKD